MYWQMKLTEITERIRHYPNNPDLRLEMVQYLCVLGEWERALKQLAQFQKLFAQQDKILVHYLLNHIEAEMRRVSVLRADYKPLTLVQDSQTDNILTQQLSLLAWLAESQTERLTECFTQLVQTVPEYTAALSFSGSLNVNAARSSEAQTHESWLMDGDVRTAFVCEVFLDGQYYWLPWHTIQSISFQPPKTLLDTLWRSAEMLLHNGSSLQATVPARYGWVADMTAYDDDLLSCKKTLWQSIADDLYVGLGQKMLFGEQGEYALLDLDRIDFRI